MNQQGGNPLSGWESYELVAIDSAGKVTAAPVREALIGSGEVAPEALTKIRHLQEMGWPDGLQWRIGKREKRRIVRKDDFIWELKCTPACWRLYFYVRPETKHFVYVHAVCKRRNRENPGDARTARERYDRRAGGGLRRLPEDD